jgi:hypothetical protein
MLVTPDALVTSSVCIMCLPLPAKTDAMSFSGVARLGIDPICFNDGPTGVANSYKSSQFPAEITYGATFNRKLTYEGGVAMGTEFKEIGITNALAVVCGGLGTRYVPLTGRNGDDELTLLQSLRWTKLGELVTRSLLVVGSHRKEGPRYAGRWCPSYHQALCRKRAGVLASRKSSRLACVVRPDLFEL